MVGWFSNVLYCSFYVNSDVFAFSGLGFAPSGLDRPQSVLDNIPSPLKSQLLVQFANLIKTDHLRNQYNVNNQDNHNKNINTIKIIRSRTIRQIGLICKYVKSTKSVKYVKSHQY